MHTPPPTIPEPNNRRINGRDQPQQHTSQIHPHSMLHADLPALLRRRLRANKNTPEEPKQRRPQHKQHPVPAERPVGFEERQAVDEDRESGQPAHHFGEDPFAVGVFAGCVGGVQVHAVQAADGQGEDELEEAED